MPHIARDQHIFGNMLEHESGLFDENKTRGQKSRDIV
jgi:hypothetical protein